MTGGARARRLAPALILASLGLAANPHLACKRAAKDTGPPPPTLGAIELRDLSTAGAEGAPVTPKIDTGALEGVVRDTLVKSGLVVLPAALPPGGSGDAGTPARSTVRVRGQVGIDIVEVDAKGLVRAAVALSLSTKPTETPGGLNEELSAASEQPFEVNAKVDRNAIGQRLLARTVGDLVGGYTARLGLAKATPEQVHAAIVSDGGALREEAIRIAGARQLKAEVPALLPLLQNNEERVRDAALGALIAMREQRAVSELTRNRSMRDRHEMRKVLEAIAILGGDEARDYLSFVAASHDDEEIRKLAADAKARLDRRTNPGALGPPVAAPPVPTNLR